MAFGRIEKVSRTHYIKLDCEEIVGICRTNQWEKNVIGKGNNDRKSRFVMGNRRIKGLELCGYGNLLHVVQTEESLQCICSLR